MRGKEADRWGGFWYPRACLRSDIIDEKEPDWQRQGVEWELGRDVPQWEEHVQRPWGGNKLGLFRGQKEARVAEHGEWLWVRSERWVGKMLQDFGATPGVWILF